MKGKNEMLRGGRKSYKVKKVITLKSNFSERR